MSPTSIGGRYRISFTVGGNIPRLVERLVASKACCSPMQPGCVVIAYAITSVVIIVLFLRISKTLQ